MKKVKPETPPKRTKYLIVGNSVAAVAAVEAIRPLDGEGTITVVSEEPYHVYSRPLISYLVAGKVSEKGMLYRDVRFYRDHRVSTVFGRRATALDVEKKKVVVDDHTDIHFEKLLIATGGTPFIPPAAGLSGPNVLTFTTYEDARKLLKLTAPSASGRRRQRAVVLGAGMIGIKAAEALLARGVEVHMVELASHILSTALDERASRMGEEACFRAGVELHLGTSITACERTGGKLYCTLADGSHIEEVDLLVVAIGVRPNVEWLRDSGLALGRGVKIDEHCATSAQDVYAAGDVAEGRELLSGKAMPIPIWPGAYRQGKVAGTNMAGGGLRYEGSLVMNSVEVMGLATISVGLSTRLSGDGLEIHSDYRPQENQYRKVVLQDDRLVGALLVGAVDRAGIYTGLIASGTPVTHFKKFLLDEGFGYISFPQKMRLEKLGPPGIAL